MEAKVKFSGNNSITALNTDGEKLVAALKIFVTKLPANDLVKLSKAIDKKPGLIKKALKYKHFII